MDKFSATNTITDHFKDAQLLITGGSGSFAFTRLRYVR